MTLFFSKEELQEKMSIASRFSLTQLSATPSLQGGMIRIEKNKAQIITTNLKDFFTTGIKTEAEKKRTIIVDFKKIVEFLNLLSPGKVEVEIRENEVYVKQDKTKGAFEVISAEDFPETPKIKGKKQALEGEVIRKELPLVLFAAAHDEARPFLTGVKFITKNKETNIVATDGFRMSVVTKKKGIEVSDTLISSDVLREVIKISGGKTKIEAIFSDKDSTVLFSIGETKIFSRIIEGEFPPFEKVIPAEYTTRATLKREEFLKSIKLTSIFARELSNIVVFEIKKDGVYFRPKAKQREGTVIHQEAEVEGEEATIAFNYKFVLDFLNNIDAKKIIFEMTKGNAPGVFKTSGNKNFLHIIMPVRTEGGGSN